MQLCTKVPGKTAVMVSRKPFKPSATAVTISGSEIIQSVSLMLDLALRSNDEIGFLQIQKELFG